MVRINNYWVVVKPLIKDTLITRNKMESVKKKSLQQTMPHLSRELPELPIRGKPKRNCMP